MATNDDQERGLLEDPGRQAKGPAAANLKGGRGSSGAGQYRAGGGGGLSRRVAISKGRKQALLKVTSFGKGRKTVGRHAAYIMRNGELELETETGELITGLDNSSRLVESWAADGFGTRKNARDTAHIVLGVPPGEDREQLSNAVRGFAQEAFEGHRYAWVRHDDTDAPHVHLMLHLTNDQGKKPHFSVKQTEAWRGQFAAHCRSHGIEVDASRAWERGRAPRSKAEQLEYRRLRDWKKLSAEEKERKRAQGYKPQLDKTDTAIAQAQDTKNRPAPLQPWERARKANAAARRAEFIADAAVLEKTAANYGQNESQALIQQAKRMREYAEGISATPTRQARLQAQIRARSAERGVEGRGVER